MYLIDTNVWLEVLLDQEKSEEAKRFLKIIPSQKLFITDFSLHSIAIILVRLKEAKVLEKFIQDLFINGDVFLIGLPPEDIYDVISVIQKFNLDFDDAYQYIAAEKYGLTIVSFDSDFDKTHRGRKTPKELLKIL